MLNEEDLRGLSINIEIAREAFAQVERRLEDVLETKKIIEQKATTLFSGYIAVSLGTFGFGAALLREPALRNIAWPFFLAGAFFVFGAAAFQAALVGAKYGYRGSSPESWLRGGVIDGQSEELGRMLSYLAGRRANMLNIGLLANDRKYRAVHIGMALGVAGSLCFGGSLAWVLRAIA